MLYVKTVLRFILLASVFLFTSRSPAQLNPDAAPHAAQTVLVPARITQAIDEKNLVTLRGNVHPLARPEFDQGPVADAQPLKRMLLLLQRSPEQEVALQHLLEDQQNKSSANYHAWLTPDQFGKQFGPPDADLQTVTQWLTSQGFTGIKVGPGRTVIEFSGNVAAVRNGFHTEIHRFLVNGEEHQANASDPQIPVALAPVVMGIVSLHNFPRKTMYHLAKTLTRSKDRGQVTLVKPDNPELTFQCGFDPNTGQPVYCSELGPYDFAAIYNVLPLWNGTPAIDGTGQTIAIANESNINVQDVRTFRSTFGLPANDPLVVLNGPDPGIIPGIETEADLDVELSGGVAKGATIKLVVSQSTETSAGVDLSAEYIVDNNLAPILSVSFGDCELNLGTAGNQFYNQLWQQAAAQGVSVFVASGDNGSAGCDFFIGQTPQPAQNGLQVSGFASTPYNTAVGGTDFNDFFNFTTYWNTTNDPTTQQSAKGYIPETTWNNSCTNAIFGDPRIGLSTNAETNCNNSRLSGFVFTMGGSGGKSSCTTPSGQVPSACSGGYAKPSWQIGSGVPLDGKRDVPDVSLFASNGFVGNSYAICQSDVLGFCSSTNLLPIGGTSASAPAFAGIMAMVNQKMQSPQGNANVVLYKLATAQSASTCNSSTGPASTCVFNDVTSGTIAMPCAKNSPNCTTSNSNDQFGVLSGYNAGPGFDLATGLGSVNVQNLVNNWSSVNFLHSSTALTATVNGSQVTSITGIPHGTAVGVSSSVTAGSGASGTPTGQVALIATPNPTPGSPSGSLGIEALTLSNGTASSSGVTLPGGSYNLTAHYQGDATFGSSDSTPGIPVNISAENSKTLISIPTFDPTTGLETGNAPTSLVYGSPYIARIDVGNAQASLSFPPKPMCTPSSCPTGTIIWTDSLNGGQPTSLDGGIFSLNSEGFTEDQPIQLSGGSHMLSASYGGDNSYNPSSNTYPIMITPAPTGVFIQVIGSPVVSGIPFQVQISGGAQAPSGLTSTAAAPTGTITLFDGSTQLGGPITVNGTGGRFPSFNIFTNLTLPTGGSHTLNANYSGDSNYAPSSFSGGNVFVLWQTSPTVNLSATNINYGQSVTVTAIVTTSGKTPPMTGTFSFFGSFTSIPGPVTPTLTTDANGNQTLSATITTTPQDSENIQLTYSGDTNYASSSASNFINVNIPDFTLQNATITVTAGQSQTATVNVAPLSSVPSPVTLSAGSFVSLPAGMSLSFNPSTANLNGAPVPVVITLTTTGPSGGPSAAAPVIPFARPTVQRRWIWWPGTLVCGLLLLLLLAIPQWRKRSKLILAASAAFIVTLALGCGGGSTSGGGGGGGGPVPTSIMLTTSQAKVASGASFTLTATVTSTKPLTGTVNIFQGHPPDGQGVAPPIQVVNGAASATVMNPFGPGTYEYWAQYTGDPNNLPSQTTTSVQEVLTGTTTAVYAGQTGGLTHQAQITVNLQ